MNDKELNSHDLARELEIVKLQEENEILKGNAENNDKVVDKVNWENMLLKKENEELKSQLRGTTHCFDEEEHKKLKEEITNLSKDVDMWNAKYNDMFDENKRLKEALEVKSYCKYANKCDELNDCSREEYEDMANANTKLSAENYDLQEENQELKKQLEECQLQNTDLRADIMIQKQAIPNKLIKDKSFYDLYDMPTYEDLLTQQKEFINYLEDMLDDENDIFSVVRVKDVLQKYKSIIGGNKDEK